MFLPTNKEEVKKLGWKNLDIILITGDAYIDSPFIGVSIIGKLLIKARYKVGIIAQPDMDSEKDITSLGEPTLFWGATSGCVDSMVANYTASSKWRKSDDFTPGGQNTKRPDRAVIAYSNLIRRYYKNTVPIVLGGIEASLRRIAHYDFWGNKVRRSILFDSKADFLVYGMGEKAVLELAEKLKSNQDCTGIRGLCYVSNELPDDDGKHIVLPSFEEVINSKKLFTNMFNIFYNNTDPILSKTLYQKQDTRYLVQNPPAHYMTPAELDEISDLDFENNAHPEHLKEGKIKALETIRFSISSHRGCYAECNFCAIAVHQGRAVRSRTAKSIINEARKITQLPDFKGYIHDVGGPTANMYMNTCKVMDKKGACLDKRCLYPETCKVMRINHEPYMDLLKKIAALPGVKKVFVSSGLRHDIVLNDKKSGDKFLEQIVKHHVSGQMKIAPEHTEQYVLDLMGKPGKDTLIEFKKKFDALNKRLGKKQFLTYYLIAAHPGCTSKDMKDLKYFVEKELKIRPEQAQIFTPTPSTYSTLMYYTGIDPFSGKKIFTEKDIRKKEQQKSVVLR